MMNVSRNAATEKRGGLAHIIRLDAPGADPSELLTEGAVLPPDQLFDAAWRNELLGRAFRLLEQRLSSQGKSQYFRIFTLYDLESGSRAPSYDAVAAEFGLTSGAVKHALSAARQEFRHAVTDLLCRYAATPELLAQELHDLFGS
jgi:hypothetical protein